MTLAFSKKVQSKRGLKEHGTRKKDILCTGPLPITNVNESIYFLVTMTS